MTTSATQGSRRLKIALDKSGFYPQLLADVLDDTLDGAEPRDHFVHLETHFDRDEVHRHSSVLVVTDTVLIVAHVDDHRVDSGGTHVRAQVSTEAVPLFKLSTLTSTYAYVEPQEYSSGDSPTELTISLSWTGGQRLDIMPASCGDPNCEAEHGYTGNAITEDITLRVSAHADGSEALEAARGFMRSLRRAATASALQAHAGRG